MTPQNKDWKEIKQRDTVYMLGDMVYVMIQADTPLALALKDNTAASTQLLDFIKQIKEKTLNRAYDEAALVAEKFYIKRKPASVIGEALYIEQEGYNNACQDIATKIKELKQ